MSETTATKVAISILNTSAPVKYGFSNAALYQRSPNELGGNQNANRSLEARQIPDEAKQAVGPSASRLGNAIVPHEVSQVGTVAVFLFDEKLNGFEVVLVSFARREGFRFHLLFITDNAKHAFYLGILLRIYLRPTPGDDNF